MGELTCYVGEMDYCCPIGARRDGLGRTIQGGALSASGADLVVSPLCVQRERPEARMYMDSRVVASGQGP